MRRRNLINGVSGVLTLSANSGTANASNGSTVSFTVTWNEVALTDSNVLVSSNQAWATPTWTASSSKVTVTCTSNTDVSNSRNATITLTYKGVSATYALTQSQGVITYDGMENTYGYNTPPYESSHQLNVKLNGSSFTDLANYTLTSNVNWITNISASQYGTVYFTVSENTDLSYYRRGIITATNGSTSLTFKIYQATAGDYPIHVVFSDLNTYWGFEDWPDNLTPIGFYTTHTNNGVTYELCASLNEMSIYEPDTGKNEYSSYWDNPYWGGYGYATDAKSYLGFENSTTILAIDNSYSTVWQTANYISDVNDNQYIHPAAQCCWRYHTAGTIQGDWFWPSVSDLSNIVTDCQEANRCRLGPNGENNWVYACEHLSLKYNVYVDPWFYGSYLGSTESSATGYEVFTPWICNVPSIWTGEDKRKDATRAALLLPSS